MTLTHPEDLIAGRQYGVLHRVSREAVRCVVGEFVSLVTVKLELYVRLEIRNAFVDVSWKSIVKIEVM